MDGNAWNFQLTFHLSSCPQKYVTVEGVMEMEESLKDISKLPLYRVCNVIIVQLFANFNLF